jgi:prepilin-type N-terminal cleavage/methylation domain-containing protein/prepilin-type processing-associated H-X9-DG protein
LFRQRPLFHFVRTVGQPHVRAGDPARAQCRAFTLLELLTTIAIIAIMAVLLLPALQGAYRKAKRISCTSQMKQMGLAFHVWAQDHNDLYPMQVPTSSGGTLEFAQQTMGNPNLSLAYRHFQALSNELVLAKVLVCPTEKTRQHARNFEELQNENISYFIHLGAAHGRTDSPIAGDRNVRTSGRVEWTFVQFNATDAVEFSAEMHGYRGNVVFGDGHVEDLDSKHLQQTFASVSNTATFTLSLPAREVPNEPSATIAAAATTPPAAGSVSASPNREAAPLAASPVTPGTPARTSNGGGSIGNSTPANTAPNTHGWDGRAVHLGSAGSSDVTIFTRLDGTVVTSTVPRHFTNMATAAMKAHAADSAPTPAVIEAVQSLARKAQRQTNWLLWLLLLMIALNILDRMRRKMRRRKVVPRF